MPEEATAGEGPGHVSPWCTLTLGAAFTPGSGLFPERGSGVKHQHSPLEPHQHTPQEPGFVLAASAARPACGEHLGHVVHGFGDSNHVWPPSGERSECPVPDLCPDTHPQPGPSPQW